MKNVLVLVLFVLIGESTCFSGYYWKDYIGKIPHDAYPAGHDATHKKTYVGLVYLADKGIIPATIYPGEKTVYAAISHNVKSALNYAQILCTDRPQNLEWIRVNRTHFYSMTMNKRLLRGGLEGNDTLNIGRVGYQGEVIIGKIMSGKAPINDAHMIYVHNGDVKFAFSYEALTVKDPVLGSVELFELS